MAPNDNAGIYPVPRKTFHSSDYTREVSLIDYTLKYRTGRHTMKRARFVGYAHLDPVYMWRWQEGVAEGRATLRSAVNLLKECSQATFVTSTPWLFKQIAAIDPGLIEEVRGLVAEGRWELIGGMWVEADVNVPCTESLVRQVLLGQLAFRDILGVQAVSGANPDSFGHAEGLPQILRKAGIESYVFMRPFEPERPIPNEVFEWEGVDGTRVLAYHLRNYGSDPDEMVHKLKQVESDLAEDREPVLAFYGVGNHGGGPTRRNIQAIDAFGAEHPEYDIGHASVADYMKEAVGECQTLPRYDTGLLHWGRGCYSTRAELKALCRHSAIALTNAEKLGASVAVLTGQEFEGSRLRDGWEHLLFNQFHDILAGTSIQESERDDRDAFGLSLTVAEEHFDQARQILASMAETGADASQTYAYTDAPAGRHLEYAGGLPVVLVNSLPWEFEGPIEMEVHDWRDVPATCVDPEGDEAPVQIGPGYGYPGAKLRRQLATFNARIPAGGFAVYTLHGRETQPREATLKVGADVLENGEVAVSLDGSNGSMKSIQDRRSGLTLDFAGEGNDLLVMRDDTDTWGIQKDTVSARKYNDMIGRFELNGIHKQSDGPVSATVRISRSFRQSVAEQYITLTEGSPLIRVRTRLIWNEPKCVLKASFPVPFTDPNLWTEIPAGAANRKDADGEWPCQKWFDVSGQLDGRSCGLAVVNDSKFACDLEQGRARLTLLRSPNWAYMYNNEEAPGRHYKVQDIGYHEFTYWLWFHAGDWREAHLPKVAEALNNPPTAVPEHCHSGRMGKASALLRSSAPNVTVSALKRSEDGTRWILRTHETEGRRTKVAIEWKAANVEWDFETAPYELRTFAIDANGGIEEVDLLEEHLTVD